MIPPDWMLKSDTITTQDERVRQAQKAYQQALARIEEDPENKALRYDLDEAAKFLVNQVRWLDQERKNKVFDRTRHEGMTAEDWKIVSHARGSVEEIKAIWDKLSSSETYELNQEDLRKLTGPNPHERMAKQLIDDYISIGSQDSGKQTEIEQNGPVEIKKEDGRTTRHLQKRFQDLQVAFEFLWNHHQSKGKTFQSEAEFIKHLDPSDKIRTEESWREVLPKLKKPEKGNLK